MVKYLLTKDMYCSLRDFKETLELAKHTHGDHKILVVMGVYSVGRDGTVTIEDFGELGEVCPDNSL